VKPSAYDWMTRVAPRMDATHAHYAGEDVGIAIKANSLGIPREEMPQIKSTHVAEFLRGVRDSGVAVKSGTAHVGDLKPTQAELNLEKVEEMRYNSSDADLEKPVIVSADGYILDGHHRWAALKTKSDRAKIQVHHVDLPIRDLLETARKFAKTTHKTVNDSL
jgi:hypothetical protein